MTKQILITITSLFITGILYAQPNIKVTEETPENIKATIPPDDVCDYYLDSGTAKQMIQYYMTNYQPRFNINQTDFFIEKCVFESIKTFFDANTQTAYDGVRFFLGLERKNIFSKWYATFFVVPTVKDPHPMPPLKAHTNMWGNLIPVFGCNTLDLYINQEAAMAKSEIDKFGSKYRNESTNGTRESAPQNTIFDQLSIGIWMNRCKIDSIAETFKKYPFLSGIKAISATYFAANQGNRYDRKYDEQTTLVFVPIDYSGNLRWETVPPPPANLAQGSYNHGALCPQQCN